MSLRRALHFVFKIGNRNETVKFYREILGMKVGIIDVVSFSVLTVKTHKNHCCVTLQVRWVAVFPF